MSLSVPAPSRAPSGSPQPIEGAVIPAPSPSASPIAAQMEDGPVESAASDDGAAAASSTADSMDISSDPAFRTHARHPRAAPLSAEEECGQFSRLYRARLCKGDEYAVLPHKWFEAWCAYSGFDRTEADNGVSSSPPGAASSSMEEGVADSSSVVRRGGGERPGYIDCSNLLQSPPDALDLSTPHAASPDGTLRASWIELRQDITEGVDFTAINYDAVLRLCEWYGGGPLIIRTVVELGLSAVPTIELFPQHLLVTPAAATDGRVQTELRRVKTFPKAALLADVIEEAKPRGLSDEERARLEGRVWRRRTTPLDPNVRKEDPTAESAVPAAASSSVRAASLTNTEFIREWEVAPKGEVTSKLEYLELDRGAELIVELRRVGEPWNRVGNGGERRWSDLRVGDILDCCDKELKWYQGEVQEITDESRGVPCAKVHFINWSVKYDELIPLVSTAFALPYVKSQTRFAPKHSFTNAPHVPNLPKKKVEESSIYSGFQRPTVGPPEVKGAVGLRNLGSHEK